MSKPPSASREPVTETYSTKDVAKIVGVPESRIRYWAQTGFVGPSAKHAGKPAYTFTDLIGLKTAKELTDRGVSIAKARRGLEALRAQLPHVEQPLASLRVLSDGERLLVVDDGHTYEPLSGQLVLDFAIGRLAGEVTELLREPPAPPMPVLPEPSTAYGWLVEGLRREQDPELETEALAAYTHAIALDPELAAAETNLGNLLHRRGALDEARQHYERALAIDPDQPEARYNLANLYDDLGDLERAIVEWYSVLALHPGFADAHFNLAVAHMKLEAPARARVHLLRYLEADRDGEWAERARGFLQTLPLT